MIGVFIFTITGLILSFVLVFVDNKFIDNDREILNHLPGYNCGACGFGSCEGMKEKILEDKKNYTKCKFIKDSETIKFFESI
ncbi:MAG: hypothetical protein J6D28_05580 [Bacilli bacterium]|nr:hypothetical protein [Bacilli bacterium]